MSTEIKVTAALDSALRRAFSDAGVRVAPSATMTDVVARFNAMGISCEVESGCLVLLQDSRQFNVALACKAFSAKPENASLFITENTDTGEWTQKQKSEFISKHGYEAWHARVTGPQLEAGVRVLDANMEKRDYLSLTRSEKMNFINEFGYGAVTAIMGRKK